VCVCVLGSRLVNGCLAFVSHSVFMVNQFIISVVVVVVVAVVAVATLEDAVFVFSYFLIC